PTGPGGTRPRGRARRPPPRLGRSRCRQLPTAASFCATPHGNRQTQPVLSTRAARAPSRLAAVNTFRSPGYRFLWSASLLWNQARWMDQVILGWGGRELKNSAWGVALIGVVPSLPIMLLGVRGGAVADRFDRRRLLIVTQGLGAAVSLGLGALRATGHFVYWHALAGAVLLGVQWAVDWPTRRALIP